MSLIDAGVEDDDTDAVVAEYRAARGLLPLTLLVHGNDELAKRELGEPRTRTLNPNPNP